jgi:hypothetical protein
MVSMKWFAPSSKPVTLNFSIELSDQVATTALIATPFAGNVPQFDLLVATEDGRSMPVQVKAINGPSWQFDATKFLKIEIEDGFQTVLGSRTDLYRDLVCVFVLLQEAGTDEFYTLTVIPPFLAGFRSRAQAAMASFCFGVIPPMPMFGRS